MLRMLHTKKNITMITFDINKLPRVADRLARSTFEEEGHRYTITRKDGEKIVCPFSTTSFIHTPFEIFDPRRVLRCMKKTTRESEKYAGKSDAEIIKMWQDGGRIASGNGTAMHNLIEDYINTGKRPDTEAYSTELDYFEQYVTDCVEGRGLEFAASEIRVFYEHDEDTGFDPLPGCVDALMKYKDKDKFFIADWKRSKRIDMPEDAFKNSMDILPDIPDVNFCHYSLQLHIYRHILVTQYGLTIDENDLEFVVFHPDNDSYKRFPAQDFSGEVETMFENYDIFSDAALRDKQLHHEISTWCDEMISSLKE